MEVHRNGSRGVKKIGLDQIRPGPGISGPGKTRTAYIEKADPGFRISNPDLSGHGPGSVPKT